MESQSSVVILSIIAVITMVALMINIMPERNLTLQQQTNDLFGHASAMHINPGYPIVVARAGTCQDYDSGNDPKTWAFVDYTPLGSSIIKSYDDHCIFIPSAPGSRTGLYFEIEYYCIPSSTGTSFDVYTQKWYCPTICGSGSHIYCY